MLCEEEQKIKFFCRKILLDTVHINTARRTVDLQSARLDDFIFFFHRTAD